MPAAPQYATAEIDPPQPYASLTLGGAQKKWPAAEVGRLLEAICRQVLERGTDALIEASYAEGLQAGALSVRDVVYSLGMTDLYRDKYGSPGDARRAVLHHYRRFLAREGEPGGVQWWTAELAKNGLPAMIKATCGSPEYLDRFGLDQVPNAALLGKPKAPPPEVKLAGLVHVQDVGDRPLKNADWNGSKGQSRRLEAFELGITPAVAGLGLQYMAHESGVGDTPWMDSPKLCGTRGQSRRIEGLAVRLTGPNAGKYDVCYQAHLQEKGDTAVAKNGAFCGTRGQSRRVEAIKVWVQAK